MNSEQTTLCLDDLKGWPERLNVREITHEDQSGERYVEIAIESENPDDSTTTMLWQAEPDEDWAMPFAQLIAKIYNALPALLSLTPRVKELEEENAQLRSSLVACGREFHELCGVHCAARIMLKERARLGPDDEEAESGVIQLEADAEASQPLDRPYSLHESLAEHGCPPIGRELVQEGLRQRIQEFLGESPSPIPTVQREERLRSELLELSRSLADEARPLAVASDNAGLCALCERIFDVTAGLLREQPASTDQTEGK